MKTTLLILPALMTMPLWPASNGQSRLANLAMDPFVGAVETMKQSIAPVVCLSVNGEESTIVDRMGSAFFVSTAGEFLTAAHVIAEMQKSDRPCPVSAIILPLEGWQPGAFDEPTAWLPFKIADCAIDTLLDVAKCRATMDPSGPLAERLKIVPVKFEWDIPPDGTQVAFTGFPLKVRDPITFRAGVAANRPVWRDGNVVPQLLLDRTAWPGFSGSPVFLSDGRVIGILFAGVLEEGTAMTFLRPASAVRGMIGQPTKK
jgi:trypsin-like peptidase